MKLTKAKQAKLKAKWAELGDVDRLSDLFSPDADGLFELYQWYQVGIELGQDEYEALAQSLCEAPSFDGSAERLAIAHFEVGLWWLLGHNTLKVNEERGLSQLRAAAKLDAAGLAPLVAKVGPLLKSTVRARFDELFSAGHPGKAKKRTTGARARG